MRIASSCAKRGLRVANVSVEGARKDARAVWYHSTGMGTLARALRPDEFASTWQPHATSTSASFGAFTLQTACGGKEVEAKAELSDHMLGVQVAGTHRIERTAEGRTLAGVSAPGTIVITPANLLVGWAATGWSSSRHILLYVPAGFIARVVAERWNREPRSVEILPRFLARDGVIEAVLCAMEFELRNGSPWGSLYAESASEFIAEHLVHKHSSLAPRPALVRGGLSQRHLKLVLDYIHDNLADAITLRTMADLVGVSPRHFERAFRQAMGVPVHKYVVYRRLDAARALLLAQPALSIEAVAAQLGFANSSHLSRHFRRRTGCSPTMFRRMNAPS
jgi:AraC family transcriptional regulator